MATKQVKNPIATTFDTFKANLITSTRTQFLGESQRQWLIDHKPTLTAAQMLQLDRVVLAELETLLRPWKLTATLSDKVSLRRLTGYTFSEKGVADTEAIARARTARVVLQRQRDAIEGVKRPSKEAASLSVIITKRVASNDEGKVAEAREACYMGLAALLQNGDATTAKRVRQLMALAAKKGL